jgi:hypothetical protein
VREWNGDTGVAYKFRLVGERRLLALFGPDASNWQRPFIAAKRTSRFRGNQYAMPNAQWIDDTLLRAPPMQKPLLDPDVADTAPSDSVLTVYDKGHVITYLRLLDADAVGADWREVARIVLQRSEIVRQPFIARQMDEGARLPAPATWWRVALKQKREPPTRAAFLSYLLVAPRHQANLARWPEPATLLPFACTEDARADSLRPLQAVHNSQHFRGRYPTAS